MSSEFPLVSVIIPVYNRDWCIADAINSLLDAQYPNLEIVVVDDGSTDDTGKILDELSHVHGNCLKIIRHPGGVNRGIAESRNLGVSLSRGKYLVFLDSDDLFEPCRFKYSIPWMEDNPDSLGGIEPFVRVDMKGETPPEINYHLTRTSVDGTDTYDSLFYSMLIRNIYWNMSSITLRREVFEEIGKFDTNLQFAEETSLWLKLTATEKVGVVQNSHAVARVRRHGDHSWDPKDTVNNHKIFLHVLLDVYSWKQKNPCHISDQASVLLEGRIPQYLVEILSSKQLSLSFKFQSWIKTVFYLPQVIINQKVLSNLFRNILGMTIQDK